MTVVSLRSMRDAVCLKKISNYSWWLLTATVLFGDLLQSLGCSQRFFAAPTSLPKTFVSSVPMSLVLWSLAPLLTNESSHTPPSFGMLLGPLALYSIFVPVVGAACKIL